MKRLTPPQKFQPSSGVTAYANQGQGKGSKGCVHVYALMRNHWIFKPGFLCVFVCVSNGVCVCE